MTQHYIQKRLAILLCIILMGQNSFAHSITTLSAQLTFSDVQFDLMDDESDMQSIEDRALLKFVGKHILKGYEDGSLRPNNPITKAELASILNRIFTLSSQVDLSLFEKKSYVDVKTKDWFNEDVTYITALEWMYDSNFTSEPHFNPKHFITREEVAYTLVNAFDLKEKLNDTTLDELGVTFEDHHLISDFAREDIAIMFQEGLLVGYPDHTIRAHEPITRGELVIILDRLIETIIIEEGTYSYEAPLNKALIITSPNCTLENTTIHSNLYMLEDTELDNVTVTGTIYLITDEGIIPLKETIYSESTGSISYTHKENDSESKPNISTKPSTPIRPSTPNDKNVIDSVVLDLTQDIPTLTWTSIPDSVYYQCRILITDLTNENSPSYSLEKTDLKEAELALNLLFTSEISENSRISISIVAYNNEKQEIAKLEVNNAELSKYVIDLDDINLTEKTASELIFTMNEVVMPESPLKVLANVSANLLGDIQVLETKKHDNVYTFIYTLSEQYYDDYPLANAYQNGIENPTITLSINGSHKSFNVPYFNNGGVVQERDGIYKLIDMPKDGYFIENPYDLVALSYLVNYGVDTSNTKYEMIQDIDFKDIEFVPIGGTHKGENSNKVDGHSFKGDFNGKGHSIINMRFDIDGPAIQEYLKTNSTLGVFGYIQGATIQNVIIDESCSFEVDVTASKSQENYWILGGLVGVASGECRIENCVNLADLSLKLLGKRGYLGGIIAYTESKTELTVFNCYNNGFLEIQSGNNSDVRTFSAGIIGYANSRTAINLASCYNSGDIQVNTYRKSYASGMIGFANLYALEYIHSLISIQNCYNSGDIYVEVQDEHAYSGGIIAYGNVDDKDVERFSIEIKNTYNSGNITAKAKSGQCVTGGILGYMNVKEEVDVELNNCYNSGNIVAGGSGDDVFVGGLVGNVYSKNIPGKLIIEEGYNIGDIKAEGGTRIHKNGIIAQSYVATTIRDCYSTFIQPNSSVEPYYTTAGALKAHLDENLNWKKVWKSPKSNESNWLNQFKDGILVLPSDLIDMKTQEMQLVIKAADRNYQVVTTGAALNIDYKLKNN